jgi:hypothetical protein
MGTPQCSCCTVYRYPPLSSNQLFHPPHSGFCRNLNRSTSSGIICDFRTSLREFLDSVVNRFTRQTLPTVHSKHLFTDILCIEYFRSQTMHNRTILFGNTLLMYCRHFDCWNQPLNMRMRVCYLDCHEAGLRYYLVIYIENFIRPLQLFYFYLWPVYWLSLVFPLTIYMSKSVTIFFICWRFYNVSRSESVRRLQMIRNRF